jgi:uncharacterized protein (DUF1810 family)
MQLAVDEWNGIIDIIEPMDSFHLDRFLQAQKGVYETALSEIKNGHKRTHWMWFIFPQIDGLAFSPTAKYFSIKNIDEARAYLDHPILGPRLLECVEAVINADGRSASEIFGHPDDLKLNSCTTLFACVSAQGSAFDRLLEKYFHGKRDGRTLQLLGLPG